MTAKPELFGLVLGGASMAVGGLCTLRLAEPRPGEALSPSGLDADQA